jgi:hypothetical protein
MTKYLIAYNIASYGEGRFKYVQSIQERLNPAITKYDRIIVGDADLKIDGFTHVPGDPGQSEDFNVSRLRNAALAYAQEKEYDWLLLFDLDAVLLGPIIMPFDGFTLSWNYHSTQNEAETGKFNLDDRTRWNGSGFFLLPRNAFHLRFDERFYGHGMEDIDFQWNVLQPAGIAARHWCTDTLHVWHDKRVPTNGNAIKNKLLLAQRLAENYGTNLDCIREWADGPLVGMIETYLWEPRLGMIESDKPGILPDQTG